MDARAYHDGRDAGSFVLHPFLKEIGFIDWAIKQEDNFLFSEIMRLVDPSKSASSYMQRLLQKAGIEKAKERSSTRFEAETSRRCATKRWMGAPPSSGRTYSGDRRA